MERNTLCERISSVYAHALVTVFFLYLPFGGYARMLEEKYTLFLALTVPCVLALLVLSRRKTRGAMPYLSLVLLALSALSCLLSPYGAETLLGGSRRNGLLTAALYLLLFFFLSQHLRPARSLVYAAGVSVTLCDALIFLQLTGANPFALYPEGLSYFDGNSAYAGEFVGCAGNADFTALLLTLAVCVFIAALLRGFHFSLLLPVFLSLLCLWQLRVATAFVGLFAFALMLPFLLLSAKRAALISLSLLLFTLAALWFVPVGSGTLYELSRMLHGEFDLAYGSGRLAIWTQLPQHIAARPLLGHGCDSLRFLDLKPFYWYVDGKTVHALITDAHSEYLTLLTERGALALAAYAGLFSLALRRCFRSLAAPRFALSLALLVPYAAMAAVSVSSCITAPYLWLTLAIIAKKD